METLVKKDNEDQADEPVDSEQTPPRVIGQGRRLVTSPEVSISPSSKKTKQILLSIPDNESGDDYIAQNVFVVDGDIYPAKLSDDNKSAVLTVTQDIVDEYGDEGVAVDVTRRDKRVSIGVFDTYVNSPGIQLLQPSKNKAKSSHRVNPVGDQRSASGDPQTQAIAINVCKLIGCENAGSFSVHRTGLDIPKMRLIEKIDTAYAKETPPRRPPSDFKLWITLSELCGIIGSKTSDALVDLLGVSPARIALRRCEAHGKCIEFHRDKNASKTLQVALNGDDKYTGGRLVFIKPTCVFTPRRPAGTITVHDDCIVHGVTTLESGVRYGLFMMGPATQNIAPI